jgi:transcriptional regulator with XRE-family HTH domain
LQNFSNNIGERIKKLIESNGYTINSFAKFLGYGSSEKLRRVINEKDAYPSYTIIFDIAKKFETLNLKWLITGSGEMLDTVKEKIIYKTSQDDIDRLMDTHIILANVVKENHELKEEIKALKNEIVQFKSSVKTPE